MENIARRVGRKINLNQDMKKLMLLLAVPALMLTACDHKKAPAAGMEALPIDVAKPVVQNVTLTKDYPGYLEAETTVDLVGRVNGTLMSKSYTPGTRIRQGQVLFVIEPTLYEDAVKQAEAALKTAQANLEYANNSYVRMKEAIKSDAVSRIQYLQAESNVAACEAAVSNAEAALKTARTNLSYCYVKAPCNGMIDVSPYSVGAYIGGALQPVKLATVYKDDHMYSYFNIADNQFLNYQLTQEAHSKTPSKMHEVTLRLGTDGSQTWKAKLDYLSPNVTLTTGTVRLRAELDNPDGALRPGLFVSVTLPYGEANNAILVDDASVGTDQLGKYLYVVNDSNIVNYRPVKVGQLVDGNLRIVNSGMSPDERYVTKALLKVRQGMPVKPVMKGANPQNK